MLIFLKYPIKIIKNVKDSGKNRIYCQINHPGRRYSFYHTILIKDKHKFEEQFPTINDIIDFVNKKITYKKLWEIDCDKTRLLESNKVRETIKQKKGKQNYKKHIAVYDIYINVKGEIHKSYAISGCFLEDIKDSRFY